MTEKIIALIKEAGNLLLSATNDIEQKGNDSNFVTATDKAVQKFLEEGLPKIYPGSIILGEESSEEELAKATRAAEGEGISHKPTWIIDPIDGTSNYIRDLGLSVISVALYEEGRVKLGFIYSPFRDEMFSAKEGEGAYLNGKRIFVSDRDFRHSHICSAMCIYAKEHAKPCFNIIERVYMQADDLRRLGSAALEMAYLAAGRVELFFEIRVFPWDVAAGYLLVKEAGGEVKVYGRDGIKVDGPFPLYAANNKENFKKFEDIILEEIPELPY